MSSRGQISELFCASQFLSQEGTVSQTYTTTKWLTMRKRPISVFPSQLYVPHLYIVRIQISRSSTGRTYNSHAAGEKPLRIWKILKATSPASWLFLDRVKNTKNPLHEISTRTKMAAKSTAISLKAISS